MAHFKIEAIVRSERDEESLGMFVEGLLEGARGQLKLQPGLSVYEITP